MDKLLFWVVVVIVVLTAMRIVASRAAARKQPPPAWPHPSACPARPRRGTDDGGQAASANGSEQMVRCAHCGIHLPRSDALLIDGYTWCSQGHALLGVHD